jgi:PAS domain S-box-containing protein
MKLSKFGCATLLLWTAYLFPAPVGRAQQSSRPKQVLVLYWEDQNHPANMDFARFLRASLQSLAPEGIEYYSEYLEANRFPGEKPSKLLHDYILQKYAGRSMDVVVATEGVALDFLLKYRSELFPNAPIVFTAAYYPSVSQLRSEAGATGVIQRNNYRKTLELALKLHPGTEHVFVVSENPPVGDTWEELARNDLQGFRGAEVTYLTDLPLEELRTKLKGLPERSIVLYVWERLQKQDGRVAETREAFQLIAPSVRVPIYGISQVHIGHGMVGGYTWMMEARTRKMAEMIVRLAGGARAADIPLETVPVVSIFDWRELQRWHIDEDLLPPDSIVRFRVLTFWQQYKWRIVGVGCVVLLQTLLIGALLVERRRVRRVAAALQESETRFRNMADTAPVLMWVSGPDKLCTFFNKAWLTFTGRDMELELGNGWVELIHPDDRGLWHETYFLSFDSRSVFQMEYRLRRADGEYRSLLCAGAPRFQNDGAFAGYIGSSLDITELKRAQEKVLSGQKLESMGLLASGIAHDFNNLLGGISASADLALAERAESASCDEELLRIKAAADGGAQIVRELMIFGATENQSFEPVDFSLPVREMIQVLKISISKTVTLKSDLPVDLGMVLGNAAQLRQLVMNLVINASQAIGDREGEIRITTKVLPQDASAMIEAEGNLSACEYLRLEVADTGDGMTEEVKAKIFAPFFSTKCAGRGLGLAVVQRIVGAHAGVIKVLSAPGSGTSFEVMLPCIPRVEIGKAAPSSGSREVAEEFFTVTVLVIEDETTLRTSISKFLRRRGFSVIEAEDGNAGVDLFLKNAARTDVVLLDMTLPGKSGRDVLYELQRIAAGVKVIVTSAYGQQHVQSLLGGLQTWGYVQKPYRVADLEEILQKCAAKTHKAGTPQIEELKITHLGS